MHAHAHMPGQISGQVPNQSGSQLPGLPHQNGNSLPQMQNLVRNAGNMDSGTELRMHMKEKIYQLIQHRQVTPEMQPRLKDIAKRLEEHLYRSATSKEDYVNMETLEHRLQSVIKRAPSNRSQQLPMPMASSSSFGTMIPTPGMQQNASLNMTAPSVVDQSMISSTGPSTGVPNAMNGGNMLQNPNGSTGGASFSSSDGLLPNGYQQSPVTIGSGGTGLMPSPVLQRPTSQMIPTPGLSNSQSAVVSEPSKKGSFYSGIDSTMSAKPQQPKQSVGGQNSRILQSLGSQMGVGVRSTMQQKPFAYGFSNGTSTGGLGLVGNNMQPMNGPITSSSYGCSPASPRSSTQHFDHQRQQHLMQSDRYGTNSAELSGIGNLYGTAAAAGSTITQQNTYPQTALMRSHTVDQSPKINFQASHASQQQLQNLKQPQVFQQQFVQRQSQHRQQSQQQNNLSQLASNLGSQVATGQGIESHGEVQRSKGPEQFRLPELQNQFQENAPSDDCSGGDQMLWNPSGPDDFGSSLSQNSQQIQQILNQHQPIESQNNFSCISAAEQPEALLQGQWHHQSHEKLHILGQSSHEQHVQEEFHQRINGQDEAQRPHLSSKGSLTSQADVTSENLYKQRWILFLRHARQCSFPEGKCSTVYCIKAQNLLKHIEECKTDKCSFSPRCFPTRVLLQHHKKCRDPACPVCVPVHRYLELQQRRARVRPPSGNSQNSVYEAWKSVDAGDAAHLGLNSGASTVEGSEDLQSMVKRIKMEHPSSLLLPKGECSPASTPVTSQPHVSQDSQNQECHIVDVPMAVKSEPSEVKRGSSVSSGRGTPSFNEIKKDTSDDVFMMKSDYGSVVPHSPAGLPKQESVENVKETVQAKQEKGQEAAALPVEAGTKSGKPKINGVSLTELFTPEQIRQHITGLRQWVGQSKAKAEKNQAMEHSMSENSCQLCAVEKLTFEPPPIYCTSCGVRIKRNAMYYTMGSGDTQRFFCIPCYNEARGDVIEVEGATTPKSRLEKKKNDEETEEWWVQCDKCEAWQHQICALFNGRRNDGGQAEYTCPNCCIDEIERGERQPLPQSAVLGAKDLPRTILSDHIEQRLFKRLKQERQDRARLYGKHFDEVPGAEALVVRVVSSVDKKLEVKQRFLEIFQEENYPIEFPYKSKVVLLFQKIEGVEVCLFGMYVQEFGSECELPNQRRVYLSYLDSVKYFRPEIKACTGEALRTFVYHEILIGYLEYCKKRGFTSCYIWACPPLKGEDYILYCHPEIQKTPKSDKLREWYLAMLRKAAKESIVVELTNLYDHFFVSTGECKAKVTAARLPYFDGDYWPGAAEDMINQLQQEEDGRKQQKKGKTKKTITKRALKAAGHSDLSLNASKDVLLMQKLGETISPMKEDFIMVHLQHSCSHCCHLLVSGVRWACKKCTNFQLCEKCYDAEQKFEERDRHPIHSRDKHPLHPVEVNDVTQDTKDKDDILESEFFDTRQAFLSLCQGNHYQYDTLRRAKHSSMMVLYHLHNPTAPAFVTTCNVCHNDVEAGHGWRCEICPDYDVCNSCYQKDGGVDHPHRLTNHPSSADRDAQNTEARQQRVLQLRKMLDLLVHASRCRFLQCPYPNCRKVKGLFRHGIQCKTRASGGCVLCKKMWYILQLHARACKESECHVPRCRDLKEHLRRLQQQSDSRRRAAVMEMMRQRAAEVAGSSG